MLKRCSKFSKKTISFLIALVSFSLLMIPNVFAANEIIGPSLVSVTPNAITVSLAFPKSGEKGNKCSIKKDSTEKWYDFDYSTNGKYTFRSLDQDTNYTIKTTYLLNNEEQTKELKVKTTKESDLVYKKINAKETEPTYKKITAKEAFDIMQKNSNYILLDVRSKEEYNTDRLSGAISIPADEINKRAESELNDKNALILVYCSMGGRSEAAAKELSQMGYTNVSNFGGLDNWPYGTVNKPSTNNIAPTNIINTGYRKITAVEAHAMMQENNNYILIDVRSKKEYDERRISGAISMPIGEIKDRAESELRDKNALIIIYCGGDSKSEDAAKMLSQMGYANVNTFG